MIPWVNGQVSLLQLAINCRQHNLIDTFRRPSHSMTLWIKDRRKDRNVNLCVTESRSLILESTRKAVLCTKRILYHTGWLRTCLYPPDQRWVKGSGGENHIQDAVADAKVLCLSRNSILNGLTCQRPYAQSTKWICNGGLAYRRLLSYDSPLIGSCMVSHKLTVRKDVFHRIVL